MSFADTNGQHLYYEDSGGAGPAIVFSHGFLMDHEMFDPQAEALRDRYRVITWDERAHGETPCRGPFDYWDSARDVLALLTHLGIESAVLAGMSQGGFLSLRAALLSPERVRGLVLIDTQAGLEDPDSLPVYRAMDDEWMANGPGAVQELTAATILGGDLDPAPWYAKWATLDRHGLHEAFECLVGRDDLTGRLGEITAPALVFHGDADTAIPMARAERLAAALPGAGAVVVVQGAGHSANLSHPDQVNGPLADFLDGLP